MSGSSLQGLSRGEALSKVTEADIMRIAKHSRNDMVQDRGTIASELFHSITACCKNLPQEHKTNNLDASTKINT
jgi:hypothetical protein